MLMTVRQLQLEFDKLWPLPSIPFLWHAWEQVGQADQPQSQLLPTCPLPETSIRPHFFYVILHCSVSVFLPLIVCWFVSYVIVYFFALLFLCIFFLSLVYDVVCLFIYNLSITLLGFFLSSCLPFLPYVYYMSMKSWPILYSKYSNN